MRLKDLAAHHDGHFNTRSDTISDLKLACLANAELADVKLIGRSRQGRKIFGYRIGNGPIHVSLLAGSHADEPVGSETIRLLILEGLKQKEALRSYFQRCTFLLIPQINPDGELRNKSWMTEWPSVHSYMGNVVRELPGDDIEFGYPDMRPENEAAVGFWKENAPVNLHISLHGMGYAEGVMLLIERHWTSRTQNMRDAYTREAASLGLGLHNHNRKGEKGFFYIEDGYTTTPEGAAMRAHFLGQGDTDTARLFHQSSMEIMRVLFGDPLSLVTEIPLFSIRNSGSENMIPENYVSLRKKLPDLQARVSKGKPIDKDLQQYNLRPVPVRDQIALQMTAIDLGIAAVERQQELTGGR